MTAATRRIWPLVLAGAATPSFAADYLTEVISEVYQAPGTASEIAQRGSTCVSQNLSPGTTDAQLIMSSDLPGGLIVARSAISYPDGMLEWQVRSVFTFEARDGRFRIVQTKLERFNRQWGPIGKWSGSGWNKAEAVFVASAAKVAACVSTIKKDDW